MQKITVVVSYIAMCPQRSALCLPESPENDLRLPAQLGRETIIWTPMLVVFKERPTRKTVGELLKMVDPFGWYSKDTTILGDQYSHKPS